MKYATFQRFVNNLRNLHPPGVIAGYVATTVKIRGNCARVLASKFHFSAAEVEWASEPFTPGKKSAMIWLLVFLALLAVDSRRKIRHTTDRVRGHFYASETTKRALGEQSGSTISKDVEMKRRQLGASRAAADYENPPGIRGIFCGYSKCYGCKGKEMSRNVADYRYSRFELCRMRIWLCKMNAYYVLTCVKK